jgi:long-chain fatty acid transport protein
MKKSLILLSILASTTAYAGSIDYLAEQDAEYFAHPSMIGKIGTSAAFYNPAGTVFMEDGTYFKINSQTVFKNYKMETNYPTIANEGTHESDHPSALVPSIQYVSKKGNRSYFIHSGVAAGGGALKYEGGLTAFEVLGEAVQISAANNTGAFANDSHSSADITYLESPETVGSSYYINTNFGMAQKLTPKFSIGGAIRFIYATRNLDCTANYDFVLDGNSSDLQVQLDAERTAYGVGGVLGFDYKATDKLNIGFKYESEVELYFESEKGRDGLTATLDPVNEGNSAKIVGTLLSQKVISEWTDKERRNLPATMSLGLSYELNDKITLLTSGNYYFIKEANRDGAYDNYDNGYEISFGIDYKLNEKVVLMAGYQYTDTGANEDTYKDTDFALDANLYGVGIQYSPVENRTYTLTYSYVDYKTDQASTDYSNSGTGTIFSKTVQAVAISAEFKF